MGHYGRPDGQHPRGAMGIGRKTPPDSVPRLFLDHLILEDLFEHGIVVVCAPSGMGKTTTARRLQGHLESRSWKTKYLSMAGKTATEIVKHLSNQRIRRAENGANDERFVVVDDIPAVDEYDAGRIARAIQRRVDTGIRFLVCLAPEALQVADQLGVAPLSTDYLQVKPSEFYLWGSACATTAPDVLWEWTRGIPTLLAAVRRDGRALKEGDSAEGDFFRHTLAALVAGDLGRFQSDEERRAKIAMLVLGRGSFAELEEVLGRDRRDMLEAAENDMILYGIDVPTSSFSCAGHMSDLIPEPALIHLLREGDGMARLVPDLLSLLADRGEFERAAQLAERFPGTRAVAERIWAYAPDFVEVGALGILRSTLAACSDDGFDCRCARAMVAAVDGTGEADGLLYGVDPETLSARQALALEYSRSLERALGGSPWDAEGLYYTDSESRSRYGDLSELCPRERALRRLELHARARKLLLTCEYVKAFRYLLSCESAHDESTLSGCLLVLDYELARVLAGDPPNASDERSARNALEFLSRSGFSDAAAFFRAWKYSLEVIFGKTDEFRDGELTLRMSVRRGDLLCQCGFLIILTLSDIRSERFVRAHVRSCMARDLAASLHLHPAVDIAAFLGAFAEHRLRNREALAVFARETEVEPLAVLAEAIVACSEGETYALEGSEPPICPSWLTPLLDLLKVGGEARARPVMARLPGSWGTELLRFEYQGRQWFPTAPVEETVVRGPEKEIRLEILGGLSVRARGQRILETDWKRRASKELLHLLAIVPGHRMSRARIVEILWPTKDYGRGRHYLYSALSNLKVVLSTYGGERDFILASGGELELNMEYVSCDIDDFVREHEKMLRNETDDAAVLNACRTMEGLYRGHLHIPAEDLMGIYYLRKRELKGMYEEAMIHGSEAALRTGDVRSAAWFARCATKSDPLGEEAMITLLRALIRQGRKKEANMEYERYTDRLIAGMGTVPSARVRALLADRKEAPALLRTAPIDPALGAEGGEAAGRTPGEMREDLQNADAGSDLAAIA